MAFNIAKMVADAEANNAARSGESWYPGFAEAQSGGNPDTVIQWVNNVLTPGIAAGMYRDYQGDTDGDFVGNTVVGMQSARARRRVLGTGITLSQSDSKHLGEAAKATAIAGMAYIGGVAAVEGIGALGATEGAAVGAGEGAVSAESADAAFAAWTPQTGPIDVSGFGSDFDAGAMGSEGGAGSGATLGDKAWSAIKAGASLLGLTSGKAASRGPAQAEVNSLRPFSVATPANFGRSSPANDSSSGALLAVAALFFVIIAYIYLKRS